MIGYFAILKAGCVVVPMSVLLRAPEVAYQLGDSMAKALITWAGKAEEAANEFRADMVHGPTGKILKTELR